jgi:transposase
MTRKRTKTESLPVIEPHAAGIDIGATQIFVAVPPDRDPKPIRCFDTFTVDLERQADWLEKCGIRTAVMESTGVYWIPLFQILERRGIETRLVNASHVKNVPGRKSDVEDCQWLQHLHSVGLLRGSFRPQQEICAIRSLWRHRESLIQMASVHLQHMQKALDQMNLQIHHVISDIAGTTGLAIIDAILAGERDPKVLAGLRDWRIRASEETIVKLLVGDYREEHLFTLRQSLVAYRYYQLLIEEVDEKVKQMLGSLPARVDVTQ